MSDETKVIDRGALYYPYIHVRDDEWLKATLLCFPFLERMVPKDYPLHDSDVASFFANTTGRAGRRMLENRSLDDKRTEAARQLLLDKIHEDVATRNLRARCSPEAAAAAHPSGRDAFQIHEYKIRGALIDFLVETGLAWAPSIPERGGARWWAVHPTLGEAIMSTNAVALARAHDLEIVTSSGPVHEALLGTEPEQVYDALMRETLPEARSDSHKVNDLLRFVIITEFDLQNLALDEIAELNKQRADLAALKAELLHEVDDLGAQPDQEVWNDVLRARAQDVVSNWAARNSLATALKRLDGATFSDDVKEFLKNVAPGVVGGTATASIASNLPGLAVGAVFAAASLWQGWSSYRRPYRYLSTLAKTTGVRRRHVLELSTA